MIVILTGAGISRESGLATFRDADGLWNKVRIEDVATPRAFAKNPVLVYEFYNARRRELTSGRIEPNPAHLALAKLERELSEPVLIVTQNVDDLHERAGSRSLLHMHGELLKARCTACDAVSAWHEDLSGQDSCPQCHQTGSMRPHIVWFEEIPLYLEEIDRALRDCRMFVSIGTSGDVYPAAGFVNRARSAGATTVELNLEPSRNHSAFDHGVYGPAGTIVPQWVYSILPQN